ncbi:unnamed protein product, partial [Mesorhabditis spiculigera]
MARVVRIPVRDSPDEPDRIKAATRLCIETWNLSQQWSEKATKTEEMLGSIVNKRLELMYSLDEEDEQKKLGHDRVTTLNRAIMEDSFTLEAALDEMERLANKFSQVETRIASLKELNKASPGALHMVQELGEIASPIKKMLLAETGARRKIFEEIGSHESRPLFEQSLILYKNSPFVNTSLLNRLYALVADGERESFIEFNLVDEDMPLLEDLVGILKSERAPLHCWVDAAIGYYVQKRNEEFIKLLETAGGDAFLEYPGIEKDQMRALDTLAAFYVSEGHRERTNKDRRKECFQKATLLYTTADKISMYEQEHLLGRAYFCLIEGNKIDQADQQFNFVLNTSPNNIPATLGKACIFYQRRDYKQALAHYKKALKQKPDCPADVRLGIGHCYAKLGKTERARAAFERCLELDKGNVAAMAALGVLERNSGDEASGVQRFAIAYQTEKTNPIVLNQLAGYFFVQKDYDRVKELALHAYGFADTDEVRADSSYQLARCHHVERDYENAFKNYYHATVHCQNHALAQHGLGQMYIQRSEYDNAIGCFEKVYKLMPNCSGSLKILAALYTYSETPVKDKTDRKQKARELLIKYLAISPDDVEALMDYAQLTEYVEPNKSLESYQKAAKLLLADGIEVPAEMLNNMGSLYMNQNKFNEARSHYEEAIKKFESETDLPDNDFLVTIRYNLGRCLEHLCLFEDAENIYKSIIAVHKDYIDCYMRLGCMMRDRGHQRDPLDFFTEALRMDRTNPDIMTMIGNWHMSQKAWGVAQKRYESIIKLMREDSFSNVGLGNIWLETLSAPNRHKEKDIVHADRALNNYAKALKLQPRNVWAAHGSACILAIRGNIPEARNLFSQVREATAEFFDVWVNIAHIYVEQNQFVNAIQMYSAAMKRFNREHDVTMIMYLARAYLKADMLNECRDTLERALIEQPNNVLAKFAYGYTLRKLATYVLKDEKSSLDLVNGAVEDLKTAERILSWLSRNRDEGYSQIRNISRTQCGEQARCCADVIKQAGQYIARAERQDESERHLRKKQEAEREALRQRILVERAAREEEEAQKKEEMVQQRRMYMQMTKDLLKMPEVASEERRGRSAGGGGGGGRGRRRKGEDGEEFVNDSSDMGYSDAGAGGADSAPRSEKRKKTKSGRKRSKKESGEESDDTDEREERRRRKKEKATAKAEERLSAKQQSKIKSRAFLSSESESSGEDHSQKKPAATASDEGTPPPPAFDDSDSADSNQSAGASKSKKRRAVVSDSSEAEKSEASEPEIESSSRRKIRPASSSGESSDGGGGGGKPDSPIRSPDSDSS